MHYITGVFWDKGKRNKNQDSLLLEQVCTRRGRLLLAAVSDGIGGLQEGETASGFITEMLLQNFYDRLIPCIRQGRGKKALQRCMARCCFTMNRMLNRYAEGKGIKLGATMTMLFLYRRNYLIVHIGDSRIYRFRNRREMEVLTADDITEAGDLSKCIGSYRYQKPAFQSGRIRKNDRFLLCTDGFCRLLKSEMLEESLGGEIQDDDRLERRLKELGVRVYRLAEEDNASAIGILCR